VPTKEGGTDREDSHTDSLRIPVEKRDTDKQFSVCRMRKEKVRNKRHWETIYGRESKKVIKIAERQTEKKDTCFKQRDRERHRARKRKIRNKNNLNVFRSDGKIIERDTEKFHLQQIIERKSLLIYWHFEDTNIKQRERKGVQYSTWAKKVSNKDAL